MNYEPELGLTVRLEQMTLNTNFKKKPACIHLSYTPYNFLVGAIKTVAFKTRVKNACVKTRTEISTVKVVDWKTLDYHLSGTC